MYLLFHVLEMIQLWKESWNRNSTNISKAKNHHS